MQGAWGEGRADARGCPGGGGRGHQDEMHQPVFVGVPPWQLVFLHTTPAVTMIFWGRRGTSAHTHTATPARSDPPWL